jgi:putative membrane protein
MGGPFYFWMGGMWVFPVIGMILMIIVISCIFVCRRGIDLCCQPWNHYDNRNLESAIEILSKRYAKGQITKEEYECMKKDILI